MAGRVLIVGGGIAGLSAALALRRSGAEVDVVELNRQWAGDDIGMIVHANFLRAVSALGLARDAIAAGFPSEGAAYEDTDGNPLAPFDGGRIAGEGYPSDLGISRLALHKILATAALAAGAKVRLGITFRHIVQTRGRVTVTLTDDSVGNYDLMIGADGVHSAVRAAVFGSHLRPQLTGKTRWRCKVRRLSDLDRPFVQVRDDSTRIAYTPINARSGCVMLLDKEPLDPNCTRELLPQIMRARLRDCSGKLAQLRERLVDPDKIFCQPVEVLFMSEPWYKGSVLLIGDASHAMTACMAQGAVQAVEDGVVLGELFAHERPIPEQLEAFMLRRYSRCKLIAETALFVEKRDQVSLFVPHVARATQRMLEVAVSPI